MLWRNLLLIASVTALDAQDWPMYLLDPTHSSFNARESVLNSTSVGSLEPLWKTNFGATISSGVTISDGVLFFGACRCARVPGASAEARPSGRKSRRSSEKNSF
jgi:putative pyrroloquinoline-quinone-binding quinoprotein